MRRTSFLLPVLAIILLCGWFTKKEKTLLMRVEGNKSHTKLGANCTYAIEKNGERKIYSYAWGPRSIQSYSVPDGKLLFEIESVGGKNGYFPSSKFTLIDDINGDGLREIATIEDWFHKDLLIFSGKDGKLLRRIPPSERIFSSTFSPWSAFYRLLTYDHNGDGVRDLFVTSSKNLKSMLILLSGKEMKPLKEFTPLELPGFTGILMNAPDLDGDGKDDILLPGYGRIGTRSILVLTYISSRTGKILKSCRLKLKEGKYIQFSKTTLPLLLNDIDGDGFPEVLHTAKQNFTFKGTTYSESILVCFSSRDGSEIWRANARKLLHKPNLMFEFQSKILCPDLNGDGIKDIIVAWYGQYFKEKDLATYLLIFSGKDGKFIKMKRIEEIKGTLPALYELIPDIDGDGKKEILAGSTDYDTGKKENAGVIFIISSRFLTS